ncbi:MAG TPA: serine/threonine-protein kinase [Ktedonobacterales bacterium]|nr:serine/threonine-protein kinase [Ktedonobacterales bacterium]
MMDRLGQIVDMYRLEALIGRGTIGDVYRAAHVYRAQRIAIKVIQPTLTSLPGFEACFRAALSSVSALHHPHVVRTIHFDTQDHTAFIVLDLATGGSLQSLLRQNAAQPALPLKQVFDLAAQAADGLAYAHTMGVAHENIKPSNLLLEHSALNSNTGNSLAATAALVLKIADFGHAALASGGNALTSVGISLGTGVMHGSPAYLSPEQCHGQPLDLRSDIYSLGVVLYQMATGQLPFQPEGLLAAIRAHSFFPPRPPHQLNANLPKALEQIIMRCLAKLPEERYPTASDLVRALQAAAPGP